jgi:hypothetical protein
MARAEAMIARRSPSLFHLACGGAVLLVLAGCTPGGTFDPTMILSSDMFDTKTKLKGDRAPVFPNGVPGTTAGVPPDLVKGYQPPPEQASADAAASGSAGAAGAQAAAAAEKPKPKPKPKIARAAAPTPGAQDPAFDQKKPPTRISVGPKPSATPPTAPAQQTAGPSQSVWPAPPTAAPAQQQSVWPNPPATNAPSH